MKLLLTDKGLKFSQEALKVFRDFHYKNNGCKENEPRISGGCDFIHSHNEVNELGNVARTKYSFNQGVPTEIDSDHYANSSSLQTFVSKGYLEILSL